MSDTETNVSANNNEWNEEKAKPIIEQYKGDNIQLAKAVHSQKQENAKYRSELDSLKKELETFKSSKKTEEPKSEAKAEAKSDNSNVQKYSIFDKVRQELFADGQVSKELREEIMKSNSLQTDSEVDGIINGVKSSYDADMKKGSSYLKKLDIKDVLKKANTVLSEREAVAFWASVESGMFGDVVEVEQRLLAKEKKTVDHGNVSSDSSNPKGAKSWNEYRQKEVELRGSRDYQEKIKELNSNTDWANLKMPSPKGRFAEFKKDGA